MGCLCTTILLLIGGATAVSILLFIPYGAGLGVCITRNATGCDKCLCSGVVGQWLVGIFTWCAFIYFLWCLVTIRDIRRATKTIDEIAVLCVVEDEHYGFEYGPVATLRDLVSEEVDPLTVQDASRCSRFKTMVRFLLSRKNPQSLLRPYSSNLTWTCTTVIGLIVGVLIATGYLLLLLLQPLGFIGYELWQIVCQWDQCKHNATCPLVLRAEIDWFCIFSLGPLILVAMVIGLLSLFLYSLCVAIKPANVIADVKASKAMMQGLSGAPFPSDPEEAEYIPLLEKKGEV